MVHEPVAYVDHIADVDEVAQLLTVSIIIAVAAEELHAARRPDLVERVEDDGSHAALVVFPRAVDVEEFEAGPEVGRVAGFLLSKRPTVECLLALAIGVEWLQPIHCAVVVRIAMFAPTVGRGTGCVHEGQTEPGTETPDFLAVPEVEPVENGGVLFRRVRPRAEVEDELDLFLVGCEPGGKVRPVDAFRASAPFVVAPLVGPRCEVVHEDEVIESFCVQARRQCTANEPGGPCDGNHGAKLLSRSAP